MTNIYDPQIEEDDGYSIPKILVAVLLLVLVGAGVYIYFQQKKLKTSVSYLLDSKKQVEQDLNQMIGRYNLAIDDNSSLETDLKDERDFIIKYRDSIRNIESKDFKEIADVKKTVLKLKEASAIQFANASASTIDNNTLPEIDSANSEEDSTEPKSEGKSTNQAKPVTSEKENNTITDNTDPTTANPVTKEVVGSPQEVAENNVVEPVKTQEKVNNRKEVIPTFNRVEIPPTYPGCEGTPNEKKACFAKKIKRHMARKFDANIVENLNIASGQQRMWVHFNVDNSGNVSNIIARGPHKKLEEEAMRVVKSLPKMTPARQNGKSVQISYSVPISINIP